jgi:hypothetical protein
MNAIFRMFPDSEAAQGETGTEPGPFPGRGSVRTARP